MFKLLSLLTLLMFSGISAASPLDQVLSIKERLRISLWVEGIEQQKPKTRQLEKHLQLPEEIERPLRKL